ncbi:Hypothetical predicted protein [Cloeon dipterum]|uniref:Beta-sarcoglycan n=1 Tax=Cloeon dipterum TaxID=197152 RepID=A0A8S1E1S3_9INSE|nr:Hypothetical predicted protein [Cloeon dipterum]
MQLAQLHTFESIELFYNETLGEGGHHWIGATDIGYEFGDMRWENGEPVDPNIIIFGPSFSEHNCMMLVPPRVERRLFDVESRLSGSHGAAQSALRVRRHTPAARMDSQHRAAGLSEEPRGTVGIYGWRKRCLYLLIVVLVAVVIVNLSLTLWLLKVMQFSSEGMGRLKVVEDGLQLRGRAMVLDALVASTIRSRPGVPISVDSSHNFSMSARDHLGRTVSRLLLGSDHFECLARGFRVTDPKGEVLFSATKGEVEIGAESLRVTGGVVFEGSVQTPVVRAESGFDLKGQNHSSTRTSLE